MGWGRMLLLGNVGQQLDFDDIQDDLTMLRQELNGLHGWGTENARLDTKQEESLRALKRENDDLKLCVATLARLLITKGVVTREEMGVVAGLIDSDRGSEPANDRRHA